MRRTAALLLVGALFWSFACNFPTWVATSEPSNREQIPLDFNPPTPVSAVSTPIRTPTSMEPPLQESLEVIVTGEVEILGGNETTPEPTVTDHSPTATPDAYAGLNIAYLKARAYGGGELQVEEVLGKGNAFTRSQVTFPSDGLSICGFMNVPEGEGPYPVVIVIHGYIEPYAYDTLAYTTRYADALARAGYLVIHPNLRGYPPSDDGPNDFRVGFAVDILNLIELIKAQGGQPGPLEKADPESIGVWGHSMGGGVAIRALTISRDIDAAVLYGSMGADDQLNYERIYTVFTQHSRGVTEILAPPEVFARISPVNYLDGIQAAVSIHHGDADETVPLEWSLDLCNRLENLGKSVECFTYPGQPHTFQGEGEKIFIRRTIEFFDRILKDGV